MLPNIPDPRSIAKSLRLRAYQVSPDLAITQWIWDQPGAVPDISTLATYPGSLIALIPDLWTLYSK